MLSSQILMNVELALELGNGEKLEDLRYLLEKAFKIFRDYG